MRIWHGIWWPKFQACLLQDWIHRSKPHLQHISQGRSTEVLDQVRASPPFSQYSPWHGKASCSAEIKAICLDSIGLIPSWSSLSCPVPPCPVPPHPTFKLLWECSLSLSLTPALWASLGWFYLLQSCPLSLNLFFLCVCGYKCWKRLETACIQSRLREQ